MRVQPRRELLEILRVLARDWFRDGAFVWGVGAGANAISHAEQLLCLLVPLTGPVAVDSPDQTDEDVLAALHVLGDATYLPRHLITAATEYLRMYSGPDGEPVFATAEYLTPGTEPVELVESFAVSVSLALAVIGLCRVFRGYIARPALRDEVDELAVTAGHRLTAAMVGLLRSFAVASFAPGSDHERNLRHVLGSAQDPELLRRFQGALPEVRAGLGEASVGMRAFDLDPRRYFACGWSWGIVAGAPAVEVDADHPRPADQHEGRAGALPDVYATSVALDAVTGILAPRTRLLGILDEEQQRLGRALQLRWELARSYWGRVATLGNHRWPLERLPWRTLTGEESDLNSLLVTRVTAEELAGRRRNTDIPFSYLIRILTDLTQRWREDSALAMAELTLYLDGTAPAQTAGYQAAGFTPLLLGTAARVALLTDNGELRRQAEDVADQGWDRLVAAAAHGASGAGPHRRTAADLLVTSQPASWHNTLRVVQALTMLVDLSREGTQRNEAPLSFAHQMLAEAEDLIARERQRPEPARADLAAVEARVRYAREIVDDHPGRAAGALLPALTELEDLQMTRRAEQPTVADF